MAIGSHLQRMSGYCALLAPRLGLDADMLRVAARLHDVGMAAVSDAVLLKRGPLTREDRRELCEHPELGYRMLCGSGVELLELAAEIAWTHHERWDGTGYPRGLAGEQIPLAGRIAAVADTWDALTTARVYRPTPKSVEGALETLTDERGRQFDAQVVAAFLELLGDAEQIRARHAVPGAEEPAAAEEAYMTLQAAAATL